MIFHKATFFECGGYDEFEEYAEDYGLWGRLLMKGEVAGVAEPLLAFRVHQASVSKQMPTSSNESPKAWHSATSSVSWIWMKRVRRVLTRSFVWISVGGP